MGFMVVKSDLSVGAGAESVVGQVRDPRMVPGLGMGLS